MHVTPANATMEGLSLVAWRRHGLLAAGLHVQSTEHLRDFLMPFIQPLAEFVAAQSYGSLAATDLADQLLVDLASRMVPSDIVLRDVFDQNGRNGSTSRCLFAAYLLRNALAHTTTDLRRGKATYLPRWPRDTLVPLLAKSGRGTLPDAEAALELITWDPRRCASRTSLDIGTTPYVKLDDKTVGMISLPGVGSATLLRHGARWPPVRACHSWSAAPTKATFGD